MNRPIGALVVELDTSPQNNLQVVGAGDIPCTPFSIDDAVKQIEGYARDVVGNGDRRIVTLGGDHTTALPMLRPTESATARSPIHLGSAARSTTSWTLSSM